MSSLVWSVALYWSHIWTLKAEDKRKIHGFDTAAYRRLLKVSWTEHETNASILHEVQRPERLLTTQGTILQSCGLCKKSVYWNALRKNQAEEETWQDEETADRRCQGLDKKNSACGVFAAGERGSSGERW